MTLGDLQYIGRPYPLRTSAAVAPGLLPTSESLHHRQMIRRPPSFVRKRHARRRARRPGLTLVPISAQFEQLQATFMS